MPHFNTSGLPALLALLIAAPAQAAFTDNGNGTVTDTVTGLMWDQCSIGQTWAAGSPPTCSGSATPLDWAAALNTAVTANTAHHRGYSDWRAPNKDELVSLVDIADGSSPTIDTTAFPSTPGVFFWSSTVYQPDSTKVWGVTFGVGGVSAFLQSGNHRVRLVRSGQPFAAFDALQPCGPGAPLTTSPIALWQMLALPCAPSPATVADVFGTGTLSNLTTGDYGTANPGAGTGWVIDRRDVGEPPAYVQLLTTDALGVGAGYWIKSYQAPTGD